MARREIVDFFRFANQEAEAKGGPANFQEGEPTLSYLRRSSIVVSIPAEADLPPFGPGPLTFLAGEWSLSARPDATLSVGSTRRSSPRISSADRSRRTKELTFPPFEATTLAMKKDYRHTLGCFDAHGNFEGGRVVHRTARGEVEGTLLCQCLPGGAQEWFIVLGWPRQHAASSQLLHLTRESNTPLSDVQLESITRKPDGIFYLVEDEQDVASR